MFLSSIFMFSSSLIRRVYSIGGEYLSVGGFVLLRFVVKCFGVLEDPPDEILDRIFQHFAKVLIEFCHKKKPYLPKNCQC